MTLHEAFEQLTVSSDFKTIAKEKNARGGKYRLYLSRFKAGELKNGAITELLLAHGYEVSAKKAKKKNKSGKIA
ncbi:MAG: hypothetical protein ACTHM7_05935 [Ginsengibacter sp.]